MAKGARRAKAKLRVRKQNKMTQASAERLIQRALKAKGKGSVSRIWAMARQASASGNIGVATNLGRIAKQKARHNWKMQNNIQYNAEMKLKMGAKALLK